MKALFIELLKMQTDHSSIWQLCILCTLILLSGCREGIRHSVAETTANERESDASYISSEWSFKKIFADVDIKAGRHADLYIPLPSGHHVTAWKFGLSIVPDGKRLDSGEIFILFDVLEPSVYEKQRPDYRPQDCVLSFIKEIKGGKNLVKNYWNPCFGGEVYELFVEDNRYFIEPNKESAPEQTQAILTSLLNAKIGD